MDFMSKVISVITYPFKLIFIFFIKVYKWCISPLLPHTCRYIPSCSTYAILAIKSFGIFKGSALEMKRILRCTPNNKAGFDLLPQNIKGDSKWII